MVWMTKTSGTENANSAQVDDDIAANSEASSGGVRTGEAETVEGESERLAWDSKFQYLLMVISYAVGLGNLWKFPYLTQKHGGGAFLIPYMVMLCIEGIPLMYLELAVGQRMRRGCIGAWDQIHPLLGGLGFTSLVSSLIVATYYNIIIVYIYFYLFQSFQHPLPWSSCPTYTPGTNVTVPVLECDLSDPASYFWYRKALNISPGIEHSGGFKWQVVGCHFLAWSIMYLCISKGIKSSGKVSYVTATLPYVVMTIFFIRGITLRGSVTGLAHMFTPKIKDLLKVQPWLDAASQIFFSLSVGFGGLIALASHNPIHNNVRKDVFLVSGTNLAMAIFTSAVTFCIIGFRATVMHEHCLDHNIGLLENICSRLNTSHQICDQHNFSAPVSHELFERTFMRRISEIENMTGPGQAFRSCSFEDDLNKGVEGAGLVFIVFTQAINEFGPSAPVWSVVFFLMLLSMGMSCMFGGMECVTASITDMDLHPLLRKKWILTGGQCAGCCTIGLLFLQGSGYYWLGLVDTFAKFYPLVLVTLLECFALTWVFSLNRFAEEIQFMIGYKPSLLWRLAWSFVTPASLLALLVGSILSQVSVPITYRVYNREKALMEDASYPWLASLVCGLVVCSVVLWIPAVPLGCKLGWIPYHPAKALAAEQHHSTPSTVNLHKDQASSV